MSDPTRGMIVGTDRFPIIVGTDICPILLVGLRCNLTAYRQVKGYKGATTEISQSAGR